MSSSDAANFDLNQMADQGLDRKDVGSAKKAAQQKATEQKQAIDEHVEAEIESIYDKAQQDKESADETARRKKIQAGFAAKATAVVHEGLYQSTPKEDRTPGMKWQHARHVTPKRLGAALLVVAGAVASNLDRLSDGVELPNIKAPDIELSFDKATSTAQLANNTASYNPDGRHFVQIKSSDDYSALYSEAVAGGHMICDKKDGSFGMIYKGRAFGSADQAETTRAQSKLNGYTDSWVTQDLDCN